MDAQNGTRRPSRRNTLEPNPGSWGGGGGGGKWRSVHKSKTHNDAERYHQGAPLLHGSTFATAGVLDADNIYADDDDKPTFNFEDYFNGGFV